MTINERNAPPTRRFGRIAVLVGLGLALPVAALSAEEDLGKLADRLIQLRGEVESLNDEIESKQQQHKNRMTSLAQRNAELEAQIQRQELEVKKLQRQIEELRSEAKAVDEASAALRPVAKEVMNALERRVDTALPFTQSERKAEIEEIRAKLQKGELSTPRALNQLWTFVEDELRLTRENGMFRQTITLDGEEQLADVVRIGMVMLFFKTGDDRFGYAEQSGEGWTYRIIDGVAADKAEKLFDSFERQVRTGYFQIPNALPGESQ